MHQRLGTLTILMVCLGSSWGKDTKPLRSMPAISNSVVNLGKMDISFHFSSPNKADGQSSTKNEYVHSASPFFLSKSEPQAELENCPCSTIKNFKNPFLNNPFDMINKILRSNDLFSSNQDPLLSSMCCDSHEPEETVFFELTPKNQYESSASFPSFSSPIQQSILPSFPMIFDSILPKAPISTPLGGKQKAIEIFFFPKNKDVKIDIPNVVDTLNVKDVRNKKNEIQIVGDKDLRNDFKSYKYRPTFPVLQKKDSRMDIEKKLEKKMEKVRQDLKEKKELKEMLVKKNELKLKDENNTESTHSAPTITAPNVITK